MVEMTDRRLPRLAAVLGGAVARREFRASFQRHVDSLWVLSDVGELRDSPYLSQLDLLVMDLSTDTLGKLQFLRAFRTSFNAGILALVLPGLTDLRVEARKAGVDECLDLPLHYEALQTVAAKLWTRVQRPGIAPKRTLEAAPTADGLLAERIARAGRYSSG